MNINIESSELEKIFEKLIWKALTNLQTKINDDYTDFIRGVIKKAEEFEDKEPEKIIMWVAKDLNSEYPYLYERKPSVFIQHDSNGILIKKEYIPSDDNLTSRLKLNPNSIDLWSGELKKVVLTVIPRNKSKY